MRAVMGPFEARHGDGSGQAGVDQELVIGADEEVFEMKSGCICCIARGDLIRILGSLVKRRDKFDHIMVETTGMADPGPVALENLGSGVTLVSRAPGGRTAAVGCEDGTVAAFLAPSAKS